MILVIAGSTPPARQIHDQIRGLIASGALSPDERLPSVRQLAKDLGLAPGTVAKAYKSLEADGYLTTRTGGGTRVSHTAATIPGAVVDAARHFAETSLRNDTDFDDAIRLLHAIWPARDPEPQQPRSPTRDSSPSYPKSRR